jgi:Ran GTPase-activating protein (RanGAP) involved in mRNA processing and transport
MSSLHTLGLSRVGLTDWAAPTLARLLEGCGGLTALDLSWNAMGPACCTALTGGLARSSSLRTLNLSWNKCALLSGSQCCTVSEGMR